ncbi:MAG: hypothetical protein A4E53_00815 [Pelotomaculum sp. PtaB.Bin104]|nr:MAG: hypothetical protein A4E53_00815 [Pelotomaculum sp. PtaB.Bin104]
MFGHQHPLSQKPASGKIIAGLNFFQLVVVLLGAKVSYELSKIIPAIPVKNFALAHIHHLIPLLLAFIAVFTKESKTGLPIAVYIYYLALFKSRKKTFVWRRS